jgi:hypothetical protein
MTVIPKHRLVHSKGSRTYSILFLGVAFLTRPFVPPGIWVCELPWLFLLLWYTLGRQNPFFQKFKTGQRCN